MNSSGPDPFDTAGLRAAVLAAWSASPARLREDANAEEALARGGYADRLLVELIANGVDAARAEGVPARILIQRLDTADGPELRVANNGAPLTPAGVAGLASLRASAKRDESDSVGHFGVGFTAVAAVSDQPVVLSRTGGVGFSAQRTRALIGQLGSGQLAELDARQGQLPLLRLPFAIPGELIATIPDGYDTQVRLPLRPAAEPAVDLLLAAVGSDLFWSVPGLSELALDLPDLPVAHWIRRDHGGGLVEIVGPAGGQQFRTVHRSGRVPNALLADRPVEERGRTAWWLTWVRPEPAVASAFSAAERGEPDRLGAPTPTDELLTLPARLIGTFPVDDTRRRLARGPLCDWLLTEAVDSYGDLFAAVPPARRWELVPGGGFPAGDIDGRLGAEILSGLADRGELVGVLGDAVLVTEALVLPGVPDEALVLLGEAMPALLTQPGSSAEAEALRRLGIRTVPAAEASSALSALTRSPEFFGRLYGLLAGQDPENWADLPVPLANGRTTIGARGALLPGDLSGELLARLADLVPALPLVHPIAADPFLLRLGAVSADAEALLTAPAVQETFRQFRETLEDDDPDPAELDRLARLGLDLLVAGAVGPIQGLVLTADDGGAWPADELLLPDAPMAAVLAEEADLPFLESAWLADYAPDTLVRAGVRSGFGARRFSLQHGLPDAASEVLPDVQDWWEQAPDAVQLGDELVAVPDLDLVDPDAWPATIALLAGDRESRPALLARDGYTGWWIGRHGAVSGRRLGHFRLASAAELAGLFDVLPVALDAQVAAAVGVLPDLATAAQRVPGELLHRYADPERRAPMAFVADLTAAIVEVVAAGHDLPERVRTLAGVAVDPDDAVVLDNPWWTQVLDLTGLIPGGADPQRTAESLDLDTATDRWAGRTAVGSGRPAADSEMVSAAVARALEALGLEPDTEMALAVRADLAVTHLDAAMPVHWWPMTGGGWWIDGSPAGIGRAVAFAAGRWSARHAAISAAGSGRAEFSGFAEDQVEN